MSSSLVMKRVGRKTFVALMEKFFHEMGAEQMNQAYGWDHAPVALLHDEIPYVFQLRRGGEVVGWGLMELRGRGSVASNGTWDREAVISRGVFPLHQRKGHGKEMMRLLLEEAKQRKAAYASRIIFKDNAGHYRETLREAMESSDSGWIYAGDFWWPAPGYGHFIYDFEDKGESKKE